MIHPTFVRHLVNMRCAIWESWFNFKRYQSYIEKILDKAIIIRYTKHIFNYNKNNKTGIMNLKLRLIC